MGLKLQVVIPQAELRGTEEAECKCIAEEMRFVVNKKQRNSFADN